MQRFSKTGRIVCFVTCSLKDFSARQSTPVFGANVCNVLVVAALLIFLIKVRQRGLECGNAPKSGGKCPRILHWLEWSLSLWRICLLLLCHV